MSMLSMLLAVPPAAVYAIVAGLVGLESVGIPLPGETALITGVLISTHPRAGVGALGIATAAFVGAVLGDSVGYAVGRRYGSGLFTLLSYRFPRHFSAAHLAYAEHLFSRYGAGAVFLGRFVALLRILAGPLAGSMHLPYRRFLLANATGAAAWAGAATSLVLALGAAAHTWVAGAGWVVLAVLLIVGVLLSGVAHRSFERRVARFEREHETMAG